MLNIFGEFVYSFSFLDKVPYFWRTFSCSFFVTPTPVNGLGILIARKSEFAWQNLTLKVGFILAKCRFPTLTTWQIIDRGPSIRCSYMPKSLSTFPIQYNPTDSIICMKRQSKVSFSAHRNTRERVVLLTETETFSLIYGNLIAV